MSNSFFRFKQFTVHQDQCSLKVCTDACLFGAWAAYLLPGEYNQPILDVGTGTGLLSLMLAQVSASAIDAVEINEDHVRQATANFTGSPWNERLQVHAVDFLKFQSPRSYGFIISNPPFFEGSLKSPDAGKNAAKHDSTLTLGPLIRKAADLLAHRGRLALLLPEHREADAVLESHKNGLNVLHIVRVRPAAGKAFFRIMMLLGKASDSPRTEEISIHNNGREYTQQFRDLLKPYYLYL